MTLTLIHSAPTGTAAAPQMQWLWSGANPADAEPPRVLNSKFIDRLAAANAASRGLRELGMVVLDVDLHADHDRATLMIERDLAQDLRPLLDAARQQGHRPWWAYDCLSNVGHVVYRGALVTWREHI